MKKFIAILTAIAALSSLKAEDITGSVSVGYESQYIFRGFKLADESMVASVDLEFDSAYLGLWTNQPLIRGYENEVDFYGGFGFDVSEGISMDVGGTVYYYPESGSNTDTFELFTGFVFETDLSPSVYVYYDLDLEALTLESSVGHSFELDDNASFDVAAFMGWVDVEGASYSYFGASADVVFSISDNSSGYVGIRATDGSSGPEGEIWGGAGLTVGF